MHKALHSRDDVDRLNVARKEGGKGLASIEDCVDASIQRFEDYIEKHDRGLITAINNETDNSMANRMTITRKQIWEEKQLYRHSNSSRKPSAKTDMKKAQWVDNNNNNNSNKSKEPLCIVDFVEKLKKETSV